MTQIRALVTMRFAPENRERLRTTVQKLTAAAAAEEGVLGMAYSVSRSGDTLYVNEHYRDAAGMLDHLLGMDPEVTQELVSLVTIESMIVCGPVTDRIEEIVAGFGNVTFAETLAENAQS